MTKQEIRELYGQSVYQIWLRVAISEFDGGEPSSAFQSADRFVKELMKRDLAQSEILTRQV